MRIVFIEIDNFRGIKRLRWAPGATVNCLIGPGDSTKTTILDAIELALNPRSYSFADDSDFHNLDYEKDVNIVVTVGGLPPEFSADDRYGMHLRGWSNETSKIEDEPGKGLEDVLSLRITVDKTHEARWSLYNDRIAADEVSDPPALRYKDAQLLATTRLGPYAERHLGWSRMSVLNRLGDASDTLGGQLADANRAARVAFSKGNPEVFKEAAERAEKLSKHFAVPIRDKYAAELDVQGVNITAGGISLHDGKLPLRRLGTGSSRLIVSALQHDAGGSHVALVDEIEHGLEPHRIARLLKYLSSPPAEDGDRPPSQIFMTTHSPVVIRELTAAEISAVRSTGGVTEVKSVLVTAKSPDAAQRHLRGSPDAFLARKIVVCEGRTEQGLVRGLDQYWTTKGKLESFALRGAIAVDGNGNGSAPILADHLVNLGYDVFLLLDSDEKVDDKLLDALKAKGGCVYEWTGGCATEERLMLDAPWTVVAALVAFAAECGTADSVKAQINKVCKAQSLPELAFLELPTSLDSAAFRSAVGKAAKNSDRPWFKDITRGERLADILGPSLEKVSGKPLGEGITTLREWIDG
jgi:hypothetical protein